MKRLLVKKNVVLVAFVSVLSLAQGLFDVGGAHGLTYSSATDIEFTFNSVISVSLSSPNLVISDLAPGEASDSNIVTIGAITNASMGYQLSATVGQKNGTDALVNTVSSSNTFANLTSAKATLANFSDNTWGYSYCADTSVNCGSGGSGTWVSGSKGSTTAGYAGLPLDNNTNASDRGLGGVLLLNTSGPEDTVQSVQFKIGAKASTGQASGDYTNTINFYAVANPEPQLGPVSCAGGYVCYYANSLGEYEGTMGRQSIGSNSIGVVLVASNYSRSNYGFAGWNTAYDYSGTFYGPNSTARYTAGQYSSQGLSLYAVWVKSAGSMQSDAVPVCNSLSQATAAGPNTLASVSALTDERDGNTYAIAKLADGKCWMIENLRLDNTAEMTIANTNNPLNNGSAVTIKHNYTDTGTYNTLSESSSTVYNADTAPNGWCGATNASCFDQSRLNSVNTSSRITYASTTAMGNLPNANHYSYGNYYNWYSATAGRGTYSISLVNTVADGSICPNGWHLPRGGNKDAETDNDYWNLFVNGLNSGTKPTNYSDQSTPYYDGITETDALKNAILSFPINFVNSGYINASSASFVQRGAYSYYLTTTARDANTEFVTYLGASTVRPGNSSGNKSLGYPARCLSR